MHESWLERLNITDELWVPSRFQKAIFEKGGYEKPIHVIEPGIDTETYWNPAHYDEYTEGDWNSMMLLNKPKGDNNSRCRPDDFKFLSVFRWLPRKAPDMLFIAFWRAFLKTRGVCLIVVTTMDPNLGEDVSQIEKQIEEFWKITKYIEFDKRPPPDHHSIMVLTNVHPRELGALYANVDAFVLPSRGEAWGRAYLEAMAMGLPTIATNWSGAVEYMTRDTTYFVSIEKELFDVNMSVNIWSHVPAEAREEVEKVLKGHKWAEPEIGDLVDMLRHVFHHPENAKYRGEKARKHVIENYSHMAVAKKIESHAIRLTKDWKKGRPKGVVPGYENGPNGYVIDYANYDFPED